MLSVFASFRIISRAPRRAPGFFLIAVLTQQAGAHYQDAETNIAGSFNR